MPDRSGLFGQRVHDRVLPIGHREHEEVARATRTVFVPVFGHQLPVPPPIMPPPPSCRRRTSHWLRTESSPWRSSSCASRRVDQRAVTLVGAVEHAARRHGCVELIEIVARVRHRHRTVDDAAAVSVAVITPSVVIDIVIV